MNSFMNATTRKDGFCATRSIWGETELVSPSVWRTGIIVAVILASVLATHAQEPTASLPVPSPNATAFPARSVRISFLPPPLEGTISLGIYNEWDQLVRVLHEEAGLDEFIVGDDALSTKWDGKDDDGQSVPAGKYQARGFAVGSLKTEVMTGPPTTPAEIDSPHPVSVKLMPNPLARDERAVIELSVGFDDENSFLKTSDGLPVYTIARKPNLHRVSVSKASEKSVDVWEDDGTVVEQLRVSNVDKMMAFDCGDFELK